MFNIFRSTQPFITGSSQYGNYRTENSDVDMVVLFEDENEYNNLVFAFKESVERIWKLADSRLYSNNIFPPLRFGQLNIIPVKNRDEYFKWKKATSLCKKIQPTSKNQAIQIFKNLGIS